MEATNSKSTLILIIIAFLFPIVAIMQSMDTLQKANRRVMDAVDGLQHNWSLYLAAVREVNHTRTDPQLRQFVEEGVNIRFVQDQEQSWQTQIVQNYKLIYVHLKSAPGISAQTLELLEPLQSQVRYSLIHYNHEVEKYDNIHAKTLNHFVNSIFLHDINWEVAEEL